MTSPDPDQSYREVFLAAVRKCLTYRPAFGSGNSDGLDLSGFRALYGADVFYAWLGLDDPMVYAAHKAAGGLTSVYRQIGVGSERLFRAVLADALGLSKTDMEWSYQYDKPDGKKGVHKLDARVRLADLDAEPKDRFEKWFEQVKAIVGASSNGAVQPRGVVFEVRQGYKSADSKRQNADLRFGVRAYQAGLLPAFAIMSSQVSEPVIQRYRNDGMPVLVGVTDRNPAIGTFAFFEQVVGYDLAAFFKRNSPALKAEVQKVVKHLLAP